MWHTGTEGGVHHHTLSCFITPLVGWLSSEPPGSLSIHTLLDSLLTALAALQGLRSGPMSDEDGKFRSWDSEAIWKLAMDSTRSDIVVAGESDPLPK